MQYKQTKLETATRSMLQRAWIKAPLALFALLFPVLGMVQPAFAAGDAAFSFATSGSTTVGGTFTVTVRVTSSAGDNVNAVQANLSYPTSQLQYASYVLDGPFDPNTYGICTQKTAGGGSAAFGCAETNGPVSGTQSFVTLNFTVIGSGSGQIKMTSGSDISSNSGASVWDGTLTSATYSFSAPVQSGGGGTTSGGTTSGGTKTGTSSGGSTSTNKTPTPTGTSTPTSGSPTTSTQPTTTTQTPTTTAKAAFTITVTDGSGKPVKGAKVSVDGQYTEYTNAQGKAGFSGLVTGSHSVTVSSPGKTTSKTTLQLSANDSKQVSLKLASAKSPVMTVVYVAVGLAVLGGAGLGYMKFFRHSGVGAPLQPVQGIVVGSDAPSMPQNATTTPVSAGPAAGPSAPRVITPTQQPVDPTASGDTLPKP